MIETGEQTLAVAAKTAAPPRLGDTGPLRKIRKGYRESAPPGLLLHTGTQIEWLTPDVLAAPWWRVL